jgi:hypothetical protein
MYPHAFKPMEAYQKLTKTPLRPVKNHKKSGD